MICFAIKICILTPAMQEIQQEMQKFDIRSKTSIENTYLRTSRNPEKKSDLAKLIKPNFLIQGPAPKSLKLTNLKRKSEPLQPNPFAIKTNPKKNKFKEKAIELFEKETSKQRSKIGENLNRKSSFGRKQCFSQKKDNAAEKRSSLSNTQHNNLKSQSDIAPVLVRANSEIESNMFGEDGLKSRLLSQQSESHSTLIKFQLGLEGKIKKESLYNLKRKVGGIRKMKEECGYSNGRSLKESMSFYTPDTKQVKNPQLEWSFNCISNAGVSFDDKSHSNSKGLGCLEIMRGCYCD